MIEPQKLHVGASPRSMMLDRASAAWTEFVTGMAGKGARPTSSG